MKQKLVSIIIPTFNCEEILVDCLESVRKQTYGNIEVIIVDSFSSDSTPEIAKKYGKVFSFGRNPKQTTIFAVPYQRNYGVEQAQGEFIYWMDSDMRIPEDTIKNSVDLMEKENADAIILPEKSYGESFWAKCRALEKDCYNKSPISMTDAARFVKKTVWDKIGGLDPTLGGNDDFDFQLRLNDAGYKTIKAPFYILHYEGKLSLSKQLKKKYVYGKNIVEYLKKHKDKKMYLTKQYSLIRPDFIQNYDLLLRDPLHAVGMIFMKVLEYSAAILGIIESQIKKEKVDLHRV